jgi:hyaluronan synthase/N-acetylglucosaminyltransferase
MLIEIISRTAIATIGIYLFLIVWRLANQVLFAYLNYLEYKKIKKSEEIKKTSIIYPIYNEDPEIFKKVAKSAISTIDINNEIIFVDDGSENITELLPIYQTLQEFGCKVFLTENKGKRMAQYKGFCEASNEIIITVDSDTIINREGVENIQKLFQDPYVGCVTGDVRVSNWNENLLTRLTSMRYWSAFHIERAAQSYADAMMCASGPFSAYRKDIINNIKNKYTAQNFLGQKCTYGDDRHLTNLVLSKGYKTKFAPDAVAHTFVPATLTTFLNQQTRWSKSFYRESLWTTKFWKNIPRYSLFDTLIQPPIFLFFILSAALNVGLFLVTLDFRFLVIYLLSILLSGFIRVWYAILFTRDISFILFVLYGYFHLFILAPFRFKALLTINNNGWGTRGVNNLFKVYIWIPIFWTFITALGVSMHLILNLYNQEYLVNKVDILQDIQQLLQFTIVISPSVLLSILFFYIITRIEKRKRS